MRLKLYKARRGLAQMLQQAVQSRMECLAFSYGCQHWLLGSFMDYQFHSETSLILS